MSEADLALLVTLDDPEEEVDIHQFQQENAGTDKGRFSVVFGDGDWTCSLSTITVNSDDPIRDSNGNTIQLSKLRSEIGVCVVSCEQNGRIVEQRVFYDLAG